MPDEPEKLTQVLEEAWRALDRGALDQAKRGAKEALALDPKSAESQTLAGAVASASGDLDAALAAFHQAMKLDPEYFDPALLAAQLTAASGELEDALALAVKALDRAEEEEEYLDALLFKAELELALEDGDAASETLAELPPADVRLPETDLHVRAGACFLELDDLENAEAHFRAAAELSPELAEAHHGLALIAEARGDEPERLVHFKKVRALDLAAPPPSFSVSEKRLISRASAIVSELPDEARDLVAKVPVRVEPYPSEEMVNEGLDPRTLALFTGVPRSEDAEGPPPDLQHILLFQRNLERDARSEEELDEQLRVALFHETAHFFGLGDDELDDEE